MPDMARSSVKVAHGLDLAVVCACDATLIELIFELGEVALKVGGFIIELGCGRIVMEQPLVLSHLILSTMPLPSYQMNYPTLQFGCVIEQPLILSL